MSHFSVMVIGAQPEKQLAPFDEKLKVTKYVKYTKEQLIEKTKKDIDNYKNNYYLRFLEDPEKYRLNAFNKEHVNFLENEFPKQLNWNDDKIYQYAVKMHSSETIGPDGEVFSTYNPKSKFDWYELGGRWANFIKVKESSKGIHQAKKGDIENLSNIIPFAVIKNGMWYEKGEMLIFGVVQNKRDDKVWEEEFKDLIKDLSDNTLISIFDCHI